MNLAKKRRAGEREPVPAIPEGTEALFDLSAYMRAHPVTVLIMEARS